MEFRPEQQRRRMLVLAGAASEAATSGARGGSTTNVVREVGANVVYNMPIIPIRGGHDYCEQGNGKSSQRAATPTTPR